MTEALQRAARIVTERLDKLATEGSADAIAEVMRAENIRALRGNKGKCALAVDLTRAVDAELGEGHGIRIRVPGGTVVYLVRPSEETFVRYNDIPTSMTGAGMDLGLINEFIFKFDSNAYPYLVSDCESEDISCG